MGITYQHDGMSGFYIFFIFYNGWLKFFKKFVNVLILNRDPF